MIAILSLVKTRTENEFAVAAALLARLAPALLFGPVAGVIVDRWNRKRLMIACDVGRAALIATLPFVGSIGDTLGVQPVLLVYVGSAGLEMLTLLWQPAKDASLPRMVRPEQLTHANGMVLLAAYATFPLSGAAFALLATAATWLGSSEILQFRELQLQQEHLALFFDSFTFMVSAAITVTLRIPAAAPAERRRLDLVRVWHEFVDGLRFIGDHPMIRPWILGIGMIFVGVGTFLSIVLFYVDRILGAGPAGYGLMVTTLGIGLGLGFALAGVVSRLVAKDVLFSVSVLGLGFSLIVFAGVSTLTVGAAMAVLLGLFAGFAYPSGLTLVQQNVSDDLRGRVLASMYSVVRVALVGSLAVAPALAKVIGRRSLELMGQRLELDGSRVAMWLGGLWILAAGAITLRAIRARQRRPTAPASGLFIVFEGGEGSGKSTQMARLGEFLRSSGRDAIVTREPGGTGIGSRIREVLLEPSGDGISSRTEALLYAADRAQHVAEVIRPSLEAGAIVISDRYLDSSLAYQGLGRGLGIDEVLNLNAWATGGLMPDVVFLLDLEARRGLERSGTSDRIEQEGIAFHERVRLAYQALSQRYAGRFVVIDASGDPDAVEQEIRLRLAPYLHEDGPEPGPGDP